MAKLLYSAAMSVDGYITGAGGDASWMVPYLGPNPEVDDLTREIGSLLVGRNTFGGDDPYKGTPHEGEAFGGAWSGPQFVLTHRPLDVAPPDVTFVGDLATGVAAAAAAAGDKVVNVLGADVARQCFAAGWIDEIFVSIVPVLLGDGVRLFDLPGGSNIALERISSSEAEHATNLRLRVHR